ncbi:MAG: hypothetical protein RIR79_580 [Pseudomonadota bacterium]
MPVTRKVSPLERNNLHLVVGEPTTKYGHFVDWLSIHQTHSGAAFPKLNDGAVFRYDADGSLDWTAVTKARVEGSHESSLFISSDGETVKFEGNVSKFDREDNVFGYSFGECLIRINAILASFGLPPFTAGVRGEYARKGKASDLSDDDLIFWTGARITRIDITENFSAGSEQDAMLFMNWLSGQQASRLKTGTFPGGETVDFGRGSKFVYSKAYLKAPELLRHARRLKDPENSGQRAYNPYLEQLARWCADSGLVRFETTYKARWLTQNKTEFLGRFDMKQINLDFEERKSVMSRTQLDIDCLADLDAKSLAVYRMWQAGDDLSTKFKKSQFYKYRKALMPYGLDIAIPNNVIQFRPRIRVVTLGSISPPAFYQRPHPAYFQLKKVA